MNNGKSPYCFWLFQ